MGDMYQAFGDLWKEPYDAEEMGCCQHRRASETSTLAPGAAVLANDAPGATIFGPPTL